MSDHASSPRAVADPVIDITDMYVFPSPGQPGHLTLVLDVFPSCGPTALFSDAANYRFRVRPVGIASSGAKAAFAVGEQEYIFNCRFAAPTNGGAGGQVAQECTFTASTGQTVSFRVNDEQGAQAQGLRVFAGVRMDPFFFDGRRALQTILTRQLAFAKVGTNTNFRQNCLSIVLELELGTIFGTGNGPLFAVVGETAVASPITIRLERFGRPEVKNVILLPSMFDTVNRDLDVRDLYNQEDAFKLAHTYLGAYRARMNANLHFYDGLDKKIDWPLDAHGNHPLTELLLADFMVVDVSKPFAEDGCYFEIEQSLLKGAAYKTCGGRWLNDHSMDTLFTLLVNDGNGPAIRVGVNHATVLASHSFPYLAPPDPNPPAPGREVPK
jgi:Domain of unknown function (DUF4331)